jgi:hypothetical protein
VSARPGRVGGFAIPLGLFVLVGIVLWGWDAWRLVRGRPTPAVVLTSGTRESRGRTGTAYRPRVEYRYERRSALATATRVRMARVRLDRAPLMVGSAADAALVLSVAGAGADMGGTTLRLERETRDVRGGRSRQRETHAPLGAEGGAAPDAAHPQTFGIPDAAPPSTLRAEEPTRTTWAFVADLRFADGHEATLRFPVRVHARS